MSSLDARPFPITALVAAGLLIVTTVIGVNLHQNRKQAMPQTVVETGERLQSRSLRFVDQGDGISVYGGHVRVFDAVTGTELPPLQERDGFVRAVLNSLSFERSKRGVSAEPVFDLVAWSDKRITIEDKATGARISLGQFGADNKAVFLRFFKQGESRP